jgi:DNA-binding CsgD family transcriptional regulator
VVAEPEQRARHAALAAEGPDSTVADLLDGAADTASARGAPAAAAELIDLAIRLTPSDDPRARNRRRLRASDLHGAVGSRARSEALLEELQSDPLTEVERAQVLMRQAAWQGVSSAIGLYEAAIPDAAGDSRLEGELEHYLGFDLAFIGRLDEGRAHLERAVELLEDTGGPLLAEVLAGLVLLEMYAAEPIPDQILDRALALEQAFGGPPRLRSPAKVAAIRLMREGRIEEARGFLDGFTARTVAYGDEALHVNALRMQVELECRAGRFDVAAGMVAELTALADQIGQPLEALHPSALVAAYREPLDQARPLAVELRDVARERDIQWEVVTAESILGFIDLSAGDAPAAWRVLAPLPGALDAMGYRETGGLPPLYVNAVEAAVGVGELEAARGLAEILEQRAERTNSGATAMAAARSAALVAGATGAHDEAVAAFGRALDLEERAPVPFERARVLLALGTVQRRAKRWADARRALDEAREIFVRVGTPLWAERAQQELARVPGRAPAGDALTPTERQVAALVAEGRSNKEVAAALFVTVKAVEANLSRVYSKLGIRSRSELARQFADSAAPTNL